MARVHFWKFLVNEAGEPIENANIYVYLAGTETPAWVYFDEFGATGTRAAPQVPTLKNGYFEFWIDDVDEDETQDPDNPLGYIFTQKFKIKWEKVGIASGTIDYIDIFPPSRFFEKVDETDPNSTYKNKVVSNYLAWLWTDHVEQNAQEEGGLPIHGFELVRPEEPDDIPNKVITNRMAWSWAGHVEDTVETYNLSAGPPHDLQPVDPTSTDDTYNKVISNKLWHDLVIIALATKSGLFTIGTGDWVLNSSGAYEYTLEHGFGETYPTVTVWDSDTKRMVKEAEAIYVDPDFIRIEIFDTAINAQVRVTT